jgi:hypothetical protein
MSVEYCHACDRHIDTDNDVDHEVMCLNRPTVGMCDRCKRVSHWQTECERDGGRFIEMPMCLLVLTDAGKLKCEHCETMYEPLPDGLKLVKACEGE